jgi:hypothetical protein
MSKPPRKNAHGIFKALLTICVSLFLVWPPSALPAQPVVLGRISANGTAEINGVGAVSGGTVFSGDQIKTERDSTALLSLTAGRQAIVLEGSSLQVLRAGSEISGVLGQGEVAVLSPANEPVVIEVGGARILPGQAGSVYAVQLTGKRLNVSARVGSVAVEAPNRTVRVPEGSTLEANLAPAQGAQGVHSAIKSNHLEIIVLVGTIVLAATTLTLLIRDLQTGCKVVSPSSLGKCEVTH